MSEKRTLFIVGTPIGHLQDITLRAVEVLRAVPVVLAEDTRVTHTLLKKIESGARCLACNEHTSTSETARLLERAGESGDVAYVSDAGTPGIADPGGKVVEAAVALGWTVVPIPGPSAVATMLSVAGIATMPFTMFGFPPTKNGRGKFFAAVAATEHTVVLYESKHRLHKTLAALQQDRYLVLGRELTKMHEQILRGTVAEVTAQLTVDKGEFVLVLAPVKYGK